ncbi:MAG: elongation factor EF-2 [Candidatus Lokiarchaeota archaeon]|nr:elongation factor EF-2 [Candidatus Lokiarchaeota archaeon]
MAGEARVLDFLEEEQERGITMKSANISLYYEDSLKDQEPFLVNLVDTPGHLDFSGKVTRALRLIDGVVVVVDAVEEIISQSETVIKQAIEEGVKPILYINKVDRLVRELRLNEDQIRKKYSRIINNFNKLIERYAESPFNKIWQVSPADGNVAFGSALHKWGFTSNQLSESGLKFKDIILKYDKETYSEDTYSDLAVYLPIDKAILEMVVNHLPNPIDAQKYRIRKIWSGDLNSEIGEAMLNCNPNGPLAICVSKVQAKKHGIIVTGRIFSGKCSIKKDVFLVRDNNQQTIQRVAIFMGQRSEQVNEIPVGNIVALEGLKNIKSGETLVESSYVDKMIPFGSVKYVTTPVITVSVEPEYLRDLEEMKKLIGDVLIEDPNLKFEIHEENGEFLLSGMGPLHLEVTAHEIEKRGVKIEISEPRAVFKESCKSKSSLIKNTSQNNKNYILLKLERLDEKSINYFQSIDFNSLILTSKQKEEMKNNTNLTDQEIDNFWKCDEDQNILIYNAKNQLNELQKSTVIEIINKIHLNGPLCGEKLTEIKLTIEDLLIEDIDDETIYTELSMLFYNAIKKGLNEAELVLLEPIYHTFIQLPPNYSKNVISILSKYSGKIKDINQEDEYQASIEIFLPVRNSIKFAEDLRSITSGRAFWQNEFYAFMNVPQHEANKIISDLRFKKGLSW